MSNLNSIPMTPLEVASSLRHLPGLVFFDSALGSGFSLVAAAPSELVRNDWELLERKLAARSGGTGFAAGFVDYHGEFCFGFYDEPFVYDHGTASWLRLDIQKLRPTSSGVVSAPIFHSDVGAPEFCEMVERARQYIAAGDIYQVNLSHQFRAEWKGDPFAFYEILRRCSPAPYAAYMELGARAILSSSPESFLDMGGRQVCTRPIKGTRPRHDDGAADAQSALELVNCPKEMAELVMITDLERNDLGQICEYGSVRASELLKLERYQQVYHLVSKVEGTLRAEVGHPEALRACFPGGSITGAPKKRAREIIAEIEPVPRGLYTGALGYFGYDGRSQFNIAIRTVVIEAGCAHFHVGAGIVADSVAEREYEETLHKASGILLASRLVAAP